VLRSLSCSPSLPAPSLGEVLDGLLAGGPLVVPGVLADPVHAVLAERQRVHAVVGGGTVKANERIRIHPVTSWGVSTVDHRHLNVGLGNQRIGEGKAARTSPYNQIIGTDEHVLPLWLCAEQRSFCWVMIPCTIATRPPRRAQCSD
jgi:hypothetical protein